MSIAIYTKGLYYWSIFFHPSQDSYLNQSQTANTTACMYTNIITVINKCTNKSTQNWACYLTLV